MTELTPAQEAALRFAREAAHSREADARRRLAAVLDAAQCRLEDLDRALAVVAERARVVLHFHPDRYGRRPGTVAQSLLADGVYRSQFETGLSSGSRTAFSGGDRDLWERELFGGAYHQEGVSRGDRPKYGALELVRFPDGPVPRFGSCYFVLEPHVGRRTTFTFGGSEHPLAGTRLGTWTEIHPVMASLLEELAGGVGTTVPWPPFVAPTLGLRDQEVASFLRALPSDLREPRPDPAAESAGRVLDSCVEAHVHGPVRLDRDVERLVVDPAFLGTATGETLDRLCRKYQIHMDWHCGFRLRAESVPEGFRGPAVRDLALRVAEEGWVDAAVIGRAEASLHSKPERWTDRGSRDETLQHLKQLWHVLVHFGEPISRQAEPGHLGP